MKKLRISFVLSVILLKAGFCCVCASAENYSFAKNGCFVLLQGDTLRMGNDWIERCWLWNDGNLITLSLENKKAGYIWPASRKTTDLTFPKEAKDASEAALSAEYVPASDRHTSHLRVTLHYMLGSLSVKKIYRIYPACPAMACELYFRGKAQSAWSETVRSAADLQNIERLTANSSSEKIPVMEQLFLKGNHWRIEATEFFDVTDRFNTLVRPVHANTYRDCLYRGNLLFAENKENGEGFFMLKEAPTSNVQLHYPGGDYLVSTSSYRMVGIGVDSIDIKQDEWVRGYGFVTGLFKGGEFEKLTALRNYQHRIRPLLPGRDEMVLLNTWGDRGQDRRVNEAFCVRELELASRLGVTHFQIDDGWQSGRSANSAFGGSFKDIWSNPDYWTPDPERFPNGLGPVVRKGRKLGIEICLWFNPSVQNDYADWEKDADALIALYRKYGIRTFKIDGVQIPNKLSETRLRAMYLKVMEATGWKAVLNLDATAGRRGGYFYFNEFGNIFLENRYTDWKNYYPYCTLRNLWMLSRYVPAQMLQIEFLNKWRNADKYAGDPFAPALYDFDYLFAITMAAQPLAWFEAANLPEEAFGTGRTIKKYKQVQHDFHRGYILPVGEEPSGRSWTGFQSVRDETGYLLVFRENNDSQTYRMKTYVAPQTKLSLTLVAGSGTSFETTVSENGEVGFSLPLPNSFALYKYNVVAPGK